MSHPRMGVVPFRTTDHCLTLDLFTCMDRREGHYANIADETLTVRDFTGGTSSPDPWCAVLCYLSYNDRSYSKQWPSVIQGENYQVSLFPIATIILLRLVKYSKASDDNCYGSWDQLVSRTDWFKFAKILCANFNWRKLIFFHSNFKAVSSLLYTVQNSCTKVMVKWN